MSGYYYDRAGQPLTLEQWAQSSPDDRRVAFDKRCGVTVSTVWLGIDHNWTGHGAPIIFETMVFGGDRDEDQWRYSTEAEAMAGHAEVCSAVLR